MTGPASKINHIGVIDTLNKSALDVFKLSGNNLGNFAFKYAAGLLTDNQIVFTSYREDPALLKKKIDVLFLPEANLLNKGIDYSAPAKFIAELDLPCFLFGVGAQATSFDDTVDVTEGTKNFIREVAKRTPQILTRGDFSTSIVRDIGVNNVLSAGCPAYLINPSKFLWKKIVIKSRKIGHLDDSVVTEGIYGLNEHNQFLYNLEKRLFDLVSCGYADYVSQANPLVMAYSMNRREEINENAVGSLKKRLCPDISSEIFETICSKQFKSFARIDAWIEYLKVKNFVLGTRIHGNLLALQAEVPALPVCHDSRTLELCQTMQLPYLLPNDILEMKSTSEFIGFFKKINNVNVQQLDERRSEIASFYVTALKDLGIEASAHIKHIANIS